MQVSLLTHVSLQQPEKLTPSQEVFNHNHRVLSQRGSTEGRFTFTAHEAGDHKICFMPISNTGHERWLNSHHQGVKISLDMVIGETSRLESTDKDRLNDLATRVKDLNARLGDVRREQVFQRVCFPRHFTLTGTFAGTLCD